MTKTQAINKLLAWLGAQVGYTEGGNNWNKYAAAIDPLGITYGAKQNQPWCAEFDLAAFVECFGVKDGLTMLYSPNPTEIPLCKAGAAYFKRAGAWHSTPEVGDIIFFIVGGDINHQGVVVEIEDGFVTAIEGNRSDRVSRNRYRLNYPAIAGYGRPNWSVVTGEKTEAIPTPATPQTDATVSGVCVNISIPMLRRGDECAAVESLQLLLIGRRFSCGGAGADGDFGPATEQAVKNAQTEYGISVDGIVGRQTWLALINNRRA